MWGFWQSSILVRSWQRPSESVDCTSMKVTYWKNVTDNITVMRKLTVVVLLRSTLNVNIKLSSLNYILCGICTMIKSFNYTTIQCKLEVDARAINKIAAAVTEIAQIQLN